MDLAVGQKDNVNPPEVLCSSSGLSSRGDEFTPLAVCMPATSPRLRSSSSSASSSPREPNSGKRCLVVEETCLKIQEALSKFDQQNEKVDKLLDALVNKFC